MPTWNGSSDTIQSLVSVAMGILFGARASLCDAQTARGSKNDGWKSVPEFAGFVKAVDGVSPMGKVNKGGEEFFEGLPNLFFKDFENTFREHTIGSGAPSRLSQSLLPANR